MSKAKQYVEQGLSLHRSGRLREATACYQQALAAQPSFGPALHYLGVCMAQQGMADMGRALVEKALATGEDSLELRMNLAQMRERAGQFTAAEADYRAAIHAAPADETPRKALIHLLAKRGDNDAIRDVLLQSLAHRPDDAEALLALVRDAYQRNAFADMQDYLARLRALDTSLSGEVMPGFTAPCAIATPTAANGPRDDVTLLNDIAREAWQGADVHILDDFLPDPDTTREWAHDLPYAARGNYPGVQTGPLACDDVMQQLADRLGWRIKWISTDNGVVRLTLGDASAKTDIHVDDDGVVETQTYAAVLYLTPPAYCQGGTSFWRHRDTGWIKRPDDQVVRAAGYADFKTFLRREIPIHSAQSFDTLQAARSPWERLFTLPMRYNRLVLYKGNYFHAIDNIFGDSFANGRLTRLFTFERY